MPTRKAYHLPRTPFRNVLGVWKCACGVSLTLHRVDHAYVPPRRSYGDTSAPCTRCGLRFNQHRPDSERQRPPRVRPDHRIEHDFVPGGGITEAGDPRCDRCGCTKRLHRGARKRKVCRCLCFACNLYVTYAKGKRVEHPPSHCGGPKCPKRPKRGAK